MLSLKGRTYFRWRRGFSINEGEFPNVHISWRTFGRRWRFYFYIAFSHRLKWWWHSNVHS